MSLVIPSKMQRTSKSLRVKDLLQMQIEGQLDLNPEIQRDEVWPKKLKTDFVFTLCHEWIDIPKVYFQKVYDNVKEEFVYKVLDGKQRITTSLNFVQNKFKYNPGKNAHYVIPEMVGRKFQAFDSYLKSCILEKSFDVVILEDYDDAHAKILFEILQNSVKLNSQEKRKPHDTYINRVIYKLSEHRFFSLVNVKEARGYRANIVTQMFSVLINPDLPLKEEFLRSLVTNKFISVEDVDLAASKIEIYLNELYKQVDLKLDMRKFTQGRLVTTMLAYYDPRMTSDLRNEFLVILRGFDEECANGQHSEYTINILNTGGYLSARQARQDFLVNYFLTKEAATA